MSQRLILFDIDGTLVDTAGAGRRAVVHACSEIFDVRDAAGIVDAIPFAGMTDWRIFESLARAAGTGFEPIWPDLQRAYLEALEVEMARPDSRRRVLPGVQELLEMLSGRDDAVLGLLTGNLERGARVKLEPFDLNRYFPAGGFGSDHPDRREVARVAHDVLCGISGIPFSPEEVVVVGDTEHDVDCATANGFRAVAVDTGWGCRAAMESARPFRLLDDLTDRHQVLESFGLN